MPTTSSDEEIVARVCRGEVALFELLMRRNNQRVYRAVRSILRDEGEIEDVMQDAYVRAYEHLRDFEGRARFSTWLIRIAVHEAFARVRRRKRFDSLESHTEESTMSTEPAASPEQRTSDVEMRSVLESAIGKLPEDFRRVFGHPGGHGENPPPPRAGTSAGNARAEHRARAAPGVRVPPEAL